MRKVNTNGAGCVADHKAGHVSLKVAQDGAIISNSQVFEFRDGNKPCSTQPEPPVSAQTDWFDTSGE